MFVLVTFSITCVSLLILGMCCGIFLYIKIHWNLRFWPLPWLTFEVGHFCYEFWGLPSYLLSLPKLAPPKDYNKGILLCFDINDNICHRVSLLLICLLVVAQPPRHRSSWWKNIPPPWHPAKHVETLPPYIKKALCPTTQSSLPDIQCTFVVVCSAWT